MYYGDRVGSRLRDLIREHLVIASQLVKAAKAGDNKTADEIEKRWYANGDEIAAFLGSINPYWSRKIGEGCTVHTLDWLNPKLLIYLLKTTQLKLLYMMNSKPRPWKWLIG
jgi:hypothetical protein